MNFDEQLREQIADKQLLLHPFYQDWNQGKLSVERLAAYSKQYYHHVSAFPRYLSATHSMCEDAEARKALLENLNDEEGGASEDAVPHPKMWKDFAEGLGATAEELEQGQPRTAVKRTIDTFLKRTRSSYAEGLGAIYAYEYQGVAVAKTKRDGLISNYGIEDEKTLGYFTEHQEADVLHRSDLERLINKLPTEDKPRALEAAKDVSACLWDLLTDLHEMDLENAH